MRARVYEQRHFVSKDSVGKLKLFINYILFDFMRAVGGARVTTRHRYAQMYVVPYPYHCVMVYDDTPDYAFVRQDDFAEFVQVHRLVRDSFGVSCYTLTNWDCLILDQVCNRTWGISSFGVHLFCCCYQVFPPEKPPSGRGTKARAPPNDSCTRCV
jgi:hypothetical protein